ncbi:putative Bgh-specific protein [Erysiphe neolycopersici]|uniref:Putative Bgh-specific protein n=1 Tax=Erysiphe neolycopersici TaxID=212602 RepID=A0A420HFH8_9PEZI|nr:putative Bgh-specific protein [Erysiphe neolycopersici]
MSTQNKRDAFARVPRNAQAAQNLKKQGATKIIINKGYINRLRWAQVSPDISEILSSTQSRLVIDVGPGRTENITLRNNNECIADSSDIQRISTLGSFINGERKAILKESISGEALKFIAALVRKTKSTDGEIKKIDDSFLSIYRVVRAQLKILIDNVQSIEATEATGSGNVLVRNHLLETARRIYVAMSKFLVHRAPAKASSEENRKINEFLLETRTMVWVFNKLTAQRLQIGGKDFEYRRLYFPRDPTKGISIQYCEIFNNELRENQIGLLESMKPYYGILSNNFLRMFCAVPKNWDMYDLSESSPAKVLKNVPIMIIPDLSAYTAEEIYQTLGKFGDRGFAWNSGATSSPQDMLRFLGTVPKRMAFGAFVRPLLKVELLQKIFPSFIYNSNDSDNRGIYGQLLVASKTAGFNNSFLQVTRVLAKEEALASFVEALKVSLEIFDVRLTQFIDAVYKAPAIIFTPGTGVTTDNLISQLEKISQVLSVEEAKQILKGSMFISTRKKIKDTDFIRMARSVLAPESEAFLKKLGSLGYHCLKPRVEFYLRAFLTETVQKAVVKEMASKFEVDVAKPIVYDKDDFSLVVDFEEDLGADGS